MQAARDSWAKEGSPSHAYVFVSEHCHLPGPGGEAAQEKQAPYLQDRNTLREGYEGVLIMALASSPMDSRIDAIEAQGQILLVTGDPHIEDLLAWTLTLAKQHFVCIATEQMIHPEWLAQWSLHPQRFSFLMSMFEALEMFSLPFTPVGEPLPPVLFHQ
jgi:hypothetical protein